MERHADLSAFIEDGHIRVTGTLADGEPCQFEVMPGRYVFITAAYPGSFRVQEPLPAGQAPDTRQLDAWLTHPAASHMLPALLDLASQLRWHEEVRPGSEDEDYRMRLDFIRGSLAALGKLAPSSRGHAKSASPGEMALMSALVRSTGTVLPSTFADEEYLTRAATALRTTALPWREDRHTGVPVAPYAMLPADLEPMMAFSPATELMAHPEVARFYLAAVAFATEGSAGNLAEYIERTTLMERSAAARGGRDVIRESTRFSWGQPDWWMTLTGDDIRAIGELNGEQALIFLERAPGCFSSSASIPLLIKLVRTGEVGPAPAQVLQRMPAHCADPGLADWVDDTLEKVTGGERALDLIQEAEQYAREEGTRVTAPAWALLLESWKEDGEAPLSWWMTLAG